MDKQRCIAAAAETEEDRLLLARLYDKLNHGAEREIFSCTAFLSPREQAMVKKLLPHVPLVFFGGCDGAERCMACYVPEYLPEDYLTSEDGPAAAVRAVYYEKDALTHRDFLGSLMGAGIKRETVGDIYVSAGQLIAAGRVAVNDLVCLKGDRQLQQGDRIAVRGLGKAALAQVGGTTRKGRLSVTLERWI